MAMFDVASFHFLSMLGPPLRELADEHRGWADVRHEINYEREVRAGELVLVRSELLAAGRSSIRYRHSMVGEDNVARAVMTAVTVHFDLDARRAIPLPLLRGPSGSSGSPISHLCQSGQ
jgi:acyl-CoA thioester hydrolase